MHRTVLLLAASLALIACAACSSTYHPEYHPSTVSNVSYPVVVGGGSALSERSPIYVVPGLPAVATSAPPEPPPPGLFAHE